MTNQHVTIWVGRYYCQFVATARAGGEVVALAQEDTQDTALAALVAEVAQLGYAVPAFGLLDPPPRDPGAGGGR